jgi:hypothetical protein
LFGANFYHAAILFAKCFFIVFSMPAQRPKRALGPETVCGPCVSADRFGLA